MKYKIIGIALGVIFGLPAIAIGSSFASSLIQGKTPSEAMDALVAQVDSLNSRLNKIEATQKVEVEQNDKVETQREVMEETPAKETQKPKEEVQTDSALCMQLKAGLVPLQDKLQNLKRELSELKKGSNSTSESNDIEAMQRNIAESQAKQKEYEKQIAEADAALKIQIGKIKDASCT